MPLKSFLAIIYTTLLTISALHMPQPLLPLLGNYFNVEMDTISLIMSATFVPLTIMPIVSGFILNFLSPKKMIFFSAIIHAFVVFAISITSTVQITILLRFIEGFMIAMILTSNTTYIALKTKREKIQFYMSYYIAFTTIGGLLGRIIGSIIATYLDWQTCFQIISVSLLIVPPVVHFFLEDIKVEKSEKSYFPFKNFSQILFDKINRKIYITIFCVFFAFTGITNFIPFRIKSLFASSSELTIGLVYSGYITGVAISFIATKIIKFLGSERKTLLYGLFVYGIFLLMFNTLSLILIFIIMFGFCSCMFLVHAVASGYLNKMATSQKSLVNGTYIAMYYTGGVLGSYVPGVIYKNFGWEICIGSLLFLVLIAIFSILRLSK
jgi:YNFM family putative membrane transporter